MAKIECMDCKQQLKIVWYAFWLWGVYDRAIAHRDKTGHCNYHLIFKERMKKNG